jgi:thiol:disulfide interchange protein
MIRRWRRCGADFVFGGSPVAHGSAASVRASLVRWTLAALVCAAVAGSAGEARAGGDWNDKGISWKSYEDGLKEAKAQKKPVLLVFYTDWCPHCTKYSGVFHDPKVVEKSKSFVMVRLNKDENAELSKKYAPDGEYIPRTFFLTPEGEVKAIRAPRSEYVYFYDTTNPAALLKAMDEALGAPATPS